MKDALKRTLVAVKDLTEQPESVYVLVAGAGGTRYYAVDRYTSFGRVVEFYRGPSSEPIFVCRTDSSWSLVNRSEVDLLTEEEVLRSSKTDHDALEKLSGELNPEKVEDSSHGVYL